MIIWLILTIPFGIKTFRTIGLMTKGMKIVLVASVILTGAFLAAQGMDMFVDNVTTISPESNGNPWLADVLICMSPGMWIVATWQWILDFRYNQRKKRRREEYRKEQERKAK